MTLTLHIPPETERRLKDQAARLGVNEAEYATRLIELSLPPIVPPIDQATIDLLAQWDKEDYTDDPHEIEARQRELDQLKESLNRNRVESGGPDAPRSFREPRHIS